MPSKKQRRRREKDRRHEYEFVYVDDTGREVEVELEEPARNGRAREPEKKAAPGKKSRARQPARGGRTGRTVQPPSWNRVFKRGLIFAPLMFFTVVLISPDRMTTSQQVLQTAFLLLVFLPFSYVMDAMTYRIWKRRSGAADEPKGRGASS